MSLTLYHYWRSSSSWRVRWALAHKELEYTAVPVNLLAGEQRTDAHRARNPLGFVPALDIGGRVLTESLAICEYLDDAFPERPLLPADPWQRARVRQLVEIVNADTQPLQNLSVLHRVSSEKQAQGEWARHFITKGLTAFEEVLGVVREEAGGPFAVGSALTLADLWLVPQLYNARRFSVDLEPYPLIREVEGASKGSRALEEAAPSAWEPKG